MTDPTTDPVTDQATPVDALDGGPAAEIGLFSLGGQDGHLREVNEAFARLLGMTPEQVHGRTLLELVHPQDLPDIVAGLAALQAGAPEVLLDSRFVQNNGATVHLQWVARALPGTGLWWAAGRDITEFRRLLAERVDLQARLGLALGQVTAAMWDLDLATGLLSFEPQAADVLGVAAGSLPATSEELAAAVHPQDAAPVLAAFATLAGAGNLEVAVRVGSELDLRYLSLRGKVLDLDRPDRPRRAVGLVLDVTAEKAMEEQMLRMVMSDALTGVPNRRAFDQALRSEWRRCTRTAEPLSVVMVDIDDFKRFNDTFGHLVGDEALCAVARALSRVMHRAGDVLARFGGEEFAVVLPGVDLTGAVTVAEQLVGSVRAVTVRQAPDWTLTVSAGAASWHPGSTTTKAVEILGQADNALYLAKAHGKDQAVHHTLALRRQPTDSTPPAPNRAEPALGVVERPSPQGPPVTLHRPPLPAALAAEPWASLTRHSRPSTDD